MPNIVSEEIVKLLNGFESELSERENLCLALHCVVFDLQRAIYDLVEVKHIRAASALLRVLFESHVKACWIIKCATDKQIAQVVQKDQFREGKVNLTLHKMIEQIEKSDPSLNNSLMTFKEKHWKGLNSFTHSGVLQLISFPSYESMPRFSLEERKKTLIDFSNRFAIASLGDVGKLTKNVDILKSVVYLSENVLGITIPEPGSH